MNFNQLLLVGFGGLLGSVTRYVASKTVDDFVKSLFPYGTLVVNIVGSFVLGLVYMLAMRKLGVTDSGRLFWGTGFCGGFTTFSTFALENVVLIQQRNIVMASVYIGVSLFLGIMAILLGIWLARSI